ncbi:diacylglycerol/lipid kinase family protein [Halarsenatibacter silvermanii]|uniref:Diacylglycerol kinase catalytic domain-containing protein n=1 Tax=Halarsenatibacter silvermanii TaxID=321763 RepID=A0A1G9KLU5_9FIRM|nr:YegS/Rv2252/BmrU family lipid kinase [Halarsenatibacter silvermanii]SDL50701.1 Diacylglycerol kinase catalytic domain-containing protein [Halarsenatibacter silvermanii]
MEKRIFLAYNSRSGDAGFKDRLHRFVEVFQQNFLLEINDIVGINLENRLKHLKSDNDTFIAAAGGDGTLNSLVNAMMLNGLNNPVMLIPVGTSNDFATRLNMPENFLALNNLIHERENINLIDIGKINDGYFINVCACGFLTSVPYETPEDLKNLVGKAAYYLKGVQKLTELKPIPLEVKTPDQSIKEEFCLFLILNSGRAGGFSDITPDSLLDDGQFEFLGIKYTGVYEMFTALVEVFVNKNWNSDENIVYFRAEEMKIQSYNTEKTFMTDIDGEKGPELPLNIEVQKQALPFVFDPKNKPIQGR